MTAPAPDPIVLLAQAGESSGQSPIGMLLLIVAMFLLMYALLIRPQQRREREHKQMVEAIQRGDGVVTSGGIHGKVTGVADDVLTVEIAERVRIKVNRSAVATRIPVKGEEEKKEAKS